MLAIWRLHGVERALRDAYADGVVLTGWSAGCICWFEAGITDSFTPELGPLSDGLAILKGSACPHYDSEERRPRSEERRVGKECRSRAWAGRNKNKLTRYASSGV